MKINSLSHASFDQVVETFLLAFADYEVQKNKEELCCMLKRRGFYPQLSFAAFCENEIVSFTCNGIGYFNGIATAYDTGTATLKEHQGKGLATQIFQHSIPYLKEAGIEQYLLEVLQHNTPAVSIYRKLGFEVCRELSYYLFKKEQCQYTPKFQRSDFTIRPIDINCFPDIPSFWDFNPSWQNSIDSINRDKAEFSAIGVFDEDRLVGYGVIEPKSGDIAQFAVDKNYRRQGIGSLVLYKLGVINHGNEMKIINCESTCQSMNAFLEKKKIMLRGKQFEMIKRL